jgi:hypothetical protein
MPAPVVIFTYNRLDHFRQTIEYLVNNKEARDSELFVFSDGAKSKKDHEIVEKIRRFASEITGFKQVTVISSEHNQGLKTSVRNGISHVLSKHGEVVVVEDDICTNANFLHFHNAALKKYKDNQQVWSISAYVIPGVGADIYAKTGHEYFLAPRASSWGWSTWKDRWEKTIWDEKELFSYLQSGHHYQAYYKTGGDKIRMLLDCFEKKNNSWAIIWDFNHFMLGTQCLYPGKSFVSNIGLDYTGVHSKPKDAYAVELSDWPFEEQSLPAVPASPEYALEKFARINRKFYRDILDVFRFRRLKKKFHSNTW